MKTNELHIDLWKDLSEVGAISGHEYKLHACLDHWLKPVVDSVVYDNLYSYVATKKGEAKQPSIMIVSHLDEIGFQVQAIREDGFVYLQPVGGWWAHVLPAHEFEIETKTGTKVFGLMGSKIPHGMSQTEKQKVMDIQDLYLDLGVQNKQEVLDLGVQIGDPVTPKTSFRLMNNENYMYGKAWDDRCAMACGVELALSLQQTKATVHIVGSAQEEVGQRGARTTAHMLNPDINIALDVTDAQDTPFHEGDIKMGAGPVLTIMDASSIAHAGLLEWVESVCQKSNIPCQYSCSTSGGTDNGNVHKSLKGIIGMTISLPSRYMHSSASIIHQEDMKQTIRLLQLLCEQLDNEVLQSIQNYNR